MIVAKVHELPLTKPYEWAKGPQLVRKTIIVTSSDGKQTGYGECAPPPHEEIDFEAMRLLCESGSDHPRVTCGRSEAELDLLARQAGEPLSVMLGKMFGRKADHKVPVNALLTNSNLSELEEEIRNHIGNGIKCFKLKVGLRGTDEMDRISRVREAIGPSSKLRLDANEAWDFGTAKSILNEAASYDIEYVEQPTPAGNLVRLARLASSVSVPIAIDEDAFSVDAITHAASLGAASNVILKPQRLGGPRPTLAAIIVAEDLGLGVTITNSLESNIGIRHSLHLAALLRKQTPCGLLTSDFFATNIGSTPIVRDGIMHLEANAGIGAIS